MSFQNASGFEKKYLISPFINHFLHYSAQKFFFRSVFRVEYVFVHRGFFTGNFQISLDFLGHSLYIVCVRRRCY